MKKQVRAPAKKPLRPATKSASKASSRLGFARPKTEARIAGRALREVAAAANGNGNGRRELDGKESLPPTTLFDLPAPIAKPIPGKEKNKTDAPDAADASDSLERVRSILFGSRMSGVDERLAEIQRELAALRRAMNELAAQIEQTRAAGDQQLEQARRGLQMSITHTQTQLKKVAAKAEAETAQREALAGILIRLGNLVRQDARDGHEE